MQRRTKMNNDLFDYIPFKARERVQALLAKEQLVVKIKKERKTKHGDYKPLSNGKHQITINSNLNPYRFLVTLVHEIAHFEAYETYGYRIKPHGKEWKMTFQHLMLPFLNPEVFPSSLVPVLARHFKNPRASSDTDTVLALAMKQFDPQNDKNYVFELPVGSVFKLHNGRAFKKGLTRRKRIECVELSSGRLYLFNPNAEVELC